MAKRKPGRPKAPEPPKAKAILHCEIDPELKGLIEGLALTNARKITGEVTLALQEHLAKHGMWPPTAKK